MCINACWNSQSINIPFQTSARPDRATLIVPVLVSLVETRDPPVLYARSCTRCVYRVRIIIWQRRFTKPVNRHGWRVRTRTPTHAPPSPTLSSKWNYQSKMFTTTAKRTARATGYFARLHLISATHSPADLWEFSEKTLLGTEKIYALRRKLKKKKIQNLQYLSRKLHADICTRYIF